MIYSLISSKTVLGKIPSRFGIQIDSIPDCIEWVGDAIAEIGYHIGFVNQLRKVKISNYKIELPCDFHSLNYFIYKGKKLKYGFPENTNRYYEDTVSELDEVLSMFNNSNLEITVNDCCIDIDAEDKEYSLETLNKRVNHLLKPLAKIPYTTDYYYTNSGQGYSTNAEGFVYIFYKAYPLDNEGFPMIVNEIKYRNAIMYFIVKCLLTTRKHPVLDYPTIKRESDSWIDKAANEHSKFTMDEMDDFAANWTNMLFRIRADNTFNHYSNA